MKAHEGVSRRSKREESGAKESKPVRPRQAPILSNPQGHGGAESNRKHPLHYGSLTYPRALPRIRSQGDSRHLFFGLIVAAVLFSNGFGEELVFDDLLAIGRNPDAASDGKVPMWDVFAHDFWGHPMDHLSSNGSYRPLVILTFRLQHWLAGGRHHVAFLHAFNFLVAYVNACLVYYVARLYDQMLTPGGRPEHAGAGGEAVTDPYSIPTAAMLLFLVHPVHVDAVTSIVGRSQALYCLCGLLAFFVAHRFLVAAGVPARAPRGVRVRRATLQLVLVLALLLLCVLCEDSGATFGVIVVVHGMLLLRWGYTSRRRVLVATALSVAFSLSYYCFRREYVGFIDLSQSPLLRRAENPQYFIPPGVLHWLSMRWTIQVKNLELLFYPTRLCSEYSYNCIPHMASVQDWRLPYYIGVSVALLSIVGGLLRAAVARRSRLALLLLVFLLWVAIPYAPVSHLFVRVGTFIAERYLYVPSIGVVLVYSFSARPVLQALVPAGRPRAALHQLPTWILWALALCWFLISYGRNTAWGTNEALARAAVVTCPGSGKAHAQLAAAIVNREQRVTPEAVGHLRRAAELDPEETSALYYLAVHAWEELHDAPRAYDLVRTCTRSPVDVARCYPLYVEMRDALFPNMTQVEKLMDEATVAPLPSQAALRMRQAGLVQRSLGADGPCSGLASLRTSLQRWSESGLYWQSSEARPEFKEETFCNTAYWWMQVFDECHLQPNTSTAEQPMAGSRHDAGRRPVVRSSEARSAMRDLRLIADKCVTNWARPGVVRGARQAKLLTYRNRLKEFRALMPRAKTTLASLRPFLVEAAVRREAVVTALQLVMSHYCDYISIVENADVRAALARHFPEEIAHVDRVAAQNRGRWRLEVVGLWKTIEDMKAEGAEETAALDVHKKHLRELATCSLSLSSIVV